MTPLTARQLAAELAKLPEEFQDAEVRAVDGEMDLIGESPSVTFEEVICEAYNERMAEDARRRHMVNVVVLSQ